MADTNGLLTIRQPSKFSSGTNPTVAPLSDTPETIKHGIIGGMTQMKRTLGTPATTTWIAFSTASTDITDYRQLVSSGQMSNTTLLIAGMTAAGGSTENPEYTAYTSFVTEPNAVDKVYANSVATTFTVTAYKGLALLNNDVYIEGKVYHRNPVGTETLLDSFEDLINTTANTQYSHSLALAKKFDTGDRFVVKYRFRNEGVPV